jgi:hypothetical protein
VLRSGSTGTTPLRFNDATVKKPFEVAIGKNGFQRVTQQIGLQGNANVTVDLKHQPHKSVGFKRPTPQPRPSPSPQIPHHTPRPRTSHAPTHTPTPKTTHTPDTKTVQVHTYVRKNGTVVQAHDSSTPHPHKQ